MKKFISVFLCMVVLLSSGFGTIGSAAAAEEISQLVLSQNEVTVETGDYQNLTATAIYVSGKTEDVTIKTTWSSADAEIATVYAGTIRGKKEGKVTVVANYLGKSVNVSVDVLKKVKILTTDKQNINIRTGVDNGVQVTLTASYEEGTPVVVTDKAQWTVDNQAIATVLNGKITGQSSGTAVVTAKYGKQTVTIPVNVEIVRRLDPSKSKISLLLQDKKDSETIELNATFQDNKIEDVAKKAEWSSDNEAVADAINGVIKAYSAGEATITAKYGTKTATIKVDVDTTMKIELDQQNVFMLIKDDPKKLKLTAFYESSSEIITEKAEWSSSDKAIASVSKGTVVAYKPGEVTITATYGDKSVSATIDVEVPRRLEAEEDYISVSVKDTTEKLLKVTAFYANSTKQVVTDKAEWSSSDDSIATVYQGKLKAHKAGEVTVTANYAGKSVAIRVDVDIPRKITATVTSVDLQIGGTEQLILKAIYGEGSNTREETITDQAEWSSSAATVAEVRKGNITGVATGAATITAKFGTRTTTIPVSVGVVKSLTVSKDSISNAAVDKLIMKKNDTVNLKVNVEYTDKTTKDVTDLATWTPAESKVAQVDSEGKVKAVGSGKAEITVSFGNKTVKIPVEVDTTESLTASDRVVFMEINQVKKISLNDSAYITEQAEWTSSSSSVVDVSKGTLTALKSGKSTITAKYGGKSVTISVEVEILEKLEANVRFLKLKSGEQVNVELTATFSGGRVDKLVAKDAEWKASSYKIADVDKGAVSGIGYGKTTVTAKYGSKSISIPVEVDQLKYLKTDHVKLEMKVGESQQVYATATYLDNSFTDVSTPALWTTSKLLVADVKDGKIKAHGVGRATITVKYAGKTTQVIVVVTK